MECTLDQKYCTLDANCCTLDANCCTLDRKYARSMLGVGA
jgi:hypothetical protein